MPFRPGKVPGLPHFQSQRRNMRDEYQKFIESKKRFTQAVGLDIGADSLNSNLFPFQRDIVHWAIKKGRAAIFADCGMGKTLMQLEWARNVPGKTLILAPLAVAHQTVREGEKFGISVAYCRNQSAVTDGITITNYEMLDHFDAGEFDGVVLDESSILKSYDGKFRNQIIESFNGTRFKLACTATPSPNDYMELGNHCEFLGAMTRPEMLATFFVHDGGETSQWRLKGHADKEFWRWICTWAVTIRKPSDLGYSDDGFTLPPLVMNQTSVPTSKVMDGYLIPLMASTLQERIKARRDTVEQRAETVASLINGDGSGDQWLIWCNLNNEADAIKKRIPGAVEIRGSDSPESKRDAMMKFTNGDIRVLVTKPSIAGFGMNWQNCHNVVFCGLSDSYEEMYQAIRRCWRFGQQCEVNVHIVTADIEGAVLQNVMRKEEAHLEMAEQMVTMMKDEMQKELAGRAEKPAASFMDRVDGKSWTVYHGDCVNVVGQLENDSIHYSVFSPPFASLYTYTDSDLDMGNCNDDNTFITHFGFLVSELFRVLVPGRLVSFHCMNLPTTKVRDGYIGIRDFRGDLIRLFLSHGFIFHSEVCIWKDPVTAMQRTKALGLLHKQLKKDSCMSRQGIPDYLVTMRKPGENPEPVSHTNETFPVDVWQRYASPVWMDINPSNTLQHRSARDEKDERHICPLQLEVIQRALELWTNPGDLVLSPFTGIGSEGYQSVKMGRKFVGAELKESYFKQAVANMREADRLNHDLFSYAAMNGAA